MAGHCDVLIMALVERVTHQDSLGVKQTGVMRLWESPMVIKGITVSGLVGKTPTGCTASIGHQ